MPRSTGAAWTSSTSTWSSTALGRGDDARATMLRIVFGSEAGADARLAQHRRHRRPGRRRADGADRQSAEPRRARTSPCRALDRVLRAGPLLDPDVVPVRATGSPIGTCSRAPDTARNTPPARPAPGGMTPRRRKPHRARRITRDSMLAYIARRMLLMIPTLFGIMLISFVDRAVRAGRAGRAHHRAAAGPRLRRDLARSPAAAATSPAERRAQAGGGADAIVVALPRRAGARPAIHQAAREAVRLRQAGATSASSRCSGTTPASISARAISATCRCCS